ncbi:hypothetical protein BGZ76_007307 [Entomortierella beljakovae]|nr:hypothetical protein BGZ76_007307 [Entomortierella beljakovae]
MPSLIQASNKGPHKALWIPENLLEPNAAESFNELVIAGCLALTTVSLSSISTLYESLKSIKIENTWMADIHIGVILEYCSALERLEIESTFYNNQNQQQSQEQQESNTQLARIILPESPIKTRLKHIDVKKVAIELRKLEQLLIGNNLNSPSSHLIELRMSQVEVLISHPTKDTQSGFGYITAKPENETQILKCIRRSSPLLDVLHFSMFHGQLSQQSQAQIFKEFPKIQKWSLSHSDILPSTFLSLQAYVNNVTSLEITCPDDIVAPLTLHEYLCCSPLLRHLWIHNMMYPAEYMDLEAVTTNSSGFYSPRNCNDATSTFHEATHQIGNKSPKGIWLSRHVWACRDLETLQIKIGGIEGDSRTARNSRIMFSYLAVVCPQLKDLSITRAMMNVELDGGLCYLGLMENLERLVLLSFHFWVKHVSEFQWLHKSSASALLKLAKAPRSPRMSTAERNRLVRTISRNSTGSSSQSVFQLQRSKTRGSEDDGTSRNIWNRVVRKILGKSRKSRTSLNRQYTRNEILRSRTIEASGPDHTGDGLDRPEDEESIIRVLTAMYKEEGVGRILNRLEKRKIRAEAAAKLHSRSDEVGHCWPLMEEFVMDAIKYPGVSSPSLEATINHLRPDITFRAFSS